MGFGHPGNGPAGCGLPAFVCGVLSLQVLCRASGPWTVHRLLAVPSVCPRFSVSWTKPRAQPENTCFLHRRLQKSCPSFKLVVFLFACLFFRVTLSRVFPTFMAAPLMAPSFETPFRSFACPWPETAPAPSAAGVSAAVAGLGRLLFYRLQYLPYNICAAL